MHKNNFPDSNFLQSCEWAKICKVKNMHLGCYDQKNLIASALLFKRPISLTKHKNIPFLSYLECSDGPLLKDSCNTNILGELLNKISRAALMNFAIQIRINLGPINKLNKSKDIASIFKSYDYKCRMWGTYLVNLEHSEDGLFNRINPKARNKVRKAIKKDLRFKEVHSADEFIENCIPVYEEAGIKNISADQIRNSFCQEAKKSYSYFLVQDSQKRNLATAGSYFYNGIATRIASAISPVCYKEKIPAQDFLTWNALVAAQKQGCTIFDMAGVNPTPNTAKEKNIKSFKSKWGGDYTEYFLFEKNMIPYMEKIKFIVNNLRK